MIMEHINMSENKEKNTARKPKALDYFKAVVLSAIVVVVVFYSHEELQVKYDAILPDIYPNENVVGTWNSDKDASSVNFDANGAAKIKNKKMIYIKTTPDNFTLFQFGRDKMGNRTGLIAHKVKLLGDTKLEMGRDSYSKLVAQK
jgi:hypothetical protein